MVKHTQTIRQQNPTNCLSGFDHFVGVGDTEFQRDVSNVIILTCHGKESFNLWLKSPKKILS